MIVNFRDTLPQQYKQMLAPYFNGMILNSLASSKQSKGMIEQADYVKSKLPAKPKTAEVAAVPGESLQKYTGEYDFEGSAVKVTLKENKTLSLVIPGQPEMELVPVSKAKFSIKYMDGYSIEFTSNDKDEVTDMLFNGPNQKVKATRKK